METNFNYICKRCFEYKTNLKSDMKKHLNRIKKCNKNINAIFISDEELVELSLTKINIQNNQTENIAHYCTQNDHFCTQIKTNVLDYAPDCTQIKTNVLAFAPDCTQIKTNVLKSDKNDLKTAPNLHPNCTEIFIDNTINNLYENNSNASIIECDICNKIFTRNSSLKRHQQNACIKNINSSKSNDNHNINISNTNTNAAGVNDSGWYESGVKIR
jgi:porphobilinogen deaminase